MDYKARFYSPYLNRFIQPDSIIPNPSNSQAFNRYSYVMNQPINFNDPTGHVGDGNSSCGVRKDQCGTRTKTPPPNVPVEHPHGGGGDDDSGGAAASGFVTPPTSDDSSSSSFFSDTSYFLDNIGAGASYINIVLADTSMALIIGGGCTTGIGCLPSIGDALVADFLITTYSPIGWVENASGVLSTLFTSLDDIFVSKTTFINVSKSGVDIGVGRDTVIAAGNALAGLTPEANYDAWISNNQLRYDNGRRSGAFNSVTQIEFKIQYSPYNLWGNGCNFFC